MYKQISVFMVDAVEIITISNSIITFVVIFPFLLNFKYYIQLKITDYLLVSLYFLFYVISYQHWFYIGITGDFITGIQIGSSFYYISNFFLIKLAIRTKWFEPPAWTNLIAYFYASMALVIHLPFFYQMVGYWHVGQYFFNPLNMLAAVFAVYCFVTTPVVANKDSNAKTAKYLWVVYTALSGFQDILFFFIGVLPDLDPIAYPWLLIFILQSNGLITQIVLLVLHIAYPEAVLFSYEQLVRASKYYKYIELKDNSIQNFGLDRIQSYINNLPIAIKEEIFAQ